MNIYSRFDFICYIMFIKVFLIHIKITRWKILCSVSSIIYVSFNLTFITICIYSKVYSIILIIKMECLWGETIKFLPICKYSNSIGCHIYTNTNNCIFNRNSTRSFIYKLVCHLTSGHVSFHCYIRKIFRRCWTY